ncbi:hypothetical protein ABZ461_12335 [Actinacidiphila glaucinigra]|uniref:hypothetical protein n=1 Tax=Actinacidiphila glaucinigra TaxID=235986 RepID=UPI0033FBF5A8
MPTPRLTANTGKFGYGTAPDFEFPNFFIFPAQVAIVASKCPVKESKMVPLLLAPARLNKLILSCLAIFDRRPEAVPGSLQGVPKQKPGNLVQQDDVGPELHKPRRRYLP